MWLYHRVMSPNDVDRMANSVEPEPDQTAPLGAVWSGSALFALAYLSENLGSFYFGNLTCQIVFMLFRAHANWARLDSGSWMHYRKSDDKKTFVSFCSRPNIYFILLTLHFLKEIFNQRKSRYSNNITQTFSRKHIDDRKCHHGQWYFTNINLFKVHRIE